MIAGAGSANTAANPGAQTVGTSPVTFTAISLNNLQAGGVNFMQAVAEYSVFSSAQSSISPGFSSNWAGWDILVDALQSASC
jgi:hypothetical protein